MANELIDEHVSTKQCRLAIDALHAHESKRQAKKEDVELLPGKEPNIWLNVTVKKIPPGHRIKPVKVPIVHPLIDPRSTPICLITKDPQREYKDLLETNHIKFISRVVGIEKLKGKFKPFEARRALLKENGMFLADERVIPMLPKLLGKKWFDAKKQPIPVCLTRKDLKGELERAVSSTYMNQNQGTCTAIKIGVLSHTPAQVLANLQKALPAIAANIKDGWANIQSLHIKTNSSVSLPIWSCSLDTSEEGRWHGLEAEELEYEEFGGISEGKGGLEDESSGKETFTKKRILRSDDDAEEDPKENPKKRAKNAEGSARKIQAKSNAAVAPAKKDSILSTPKPLPQKDGKVKAVAKPQRPDANNSKSVPDKLGKSKTSKASTVIASADGVKPSESAKTKRPRADVQNVAARAVPEPKSVSKTETRLKSTFPLGKKKEKIAKQRGGKSAKNTLLGKKAARQ